MDSKHQHHQRIVHVLQSMNAKLLQDTQCLFGGGTALALQLNEFRLSTDIDFICSSHEGYRKLRSLIEQFSMTGLASLFNKPIDQLREVRADRYGIRSVLHIDGTPIKFEIVREDRISLDASVELLHSVPTISRADAFAEKLLANSDRWADKSVLSRDVMDLAVMINAWGDIPPEAQKKACSAYGPTITKDLISAATLVLGDDEYRNRCFNELRIDERDWRDVIAGLSKMSQHRQSATPGCAPDDDEEPGPSPG